MDTQELDPDYVTKGEIESKVLTDIFAKFGLLIEYGDLPEINYRDLQERHDNPADEIVYLLREDVVEIGDSENITLKKSYRDTASRIAREIHNKIRSEGEILEDEWIPELISEPGIKEDYNPPIEEIDQNPDEELPTRIFEVLSGGRELKPSEIEEELVVDLNFDIEDRMKYLETQSVVERREDNRYRLNPDYIAEEFFGEEVNLEGKLVSEERYRDDPWKP